MKRVAELGEFGLIDRIRAIAGDGSGAQVVLGIGDDAALLRPRPNEDWVVTTDALVEDAHFRFDTQGPTAIGRRALAVNLSDLAAMGARPVAFTLALTLNPKMPLRRFDGVLRGLVAMAMTHRCPLVGGNMARGEQTTLAISAFGTVSRGRALRRDAVRAGDRLFVTGVLGEAALELARAERAGGRVRRVPVPRIEAGRALARTAGAGGCIDISDGLLADLSHLLETRSLGAQIDPASVPRPARFDVRARRLGIAPDELLFAGGEDYELLFSARRSAPSAAVLAKRLGVRVTEIGTVRREPGIRGLERAIARPGWRHF